MKLAVDGGIKAIEHHARHGEGVYGVQWGDPRAGWPFGQRLLEDYLVPMIPRGVDVLEIGCGGGRWTREILGREPRTLWLADGSDASLSLIRRHCSLGPNVKFAVDPTGELLHVPSYSVDVVWSYDTHVHFDPRLFDTSFEAIMRVLREDGECLLHYACDQGQEQYNPTAFYYRRRTEINDWIEANCCEVLEEIPVPNGLGSMIVMFKKK